MTSRWQRFFRLSPIERSLFVRAIVLLPITAGVLWFIRLRDVERLLGAPENSDCLRAETTKEKRELVETARRMVAAASRHGMVRGNCLSKSIVLTHLLRRHGVDASVHVGARKDGPAFEAHAWVELNGHAINDSPDVRKRFAAFERHADGALSEMRVGE